MPIATSDDVQLHLGRTLTPEEAAQLPGWSEALDAAVHAETFTAAATGEGDTAVVEFRMTERRSVVRVPGPVTDVLEVTADSAVVEVRAWSRGGEIRFGQCLDVGAVVSVECTRGELPTQLRAWVAMRLAAAFRAAASAAAMTGTTGRGVVEQAIEGTSIGFARPDAGTLDHIFAAGSRFLVLSDEDRRQVRRMAGVPAASTIEMMR